MGLKSRFYAPPVHPMSARLTQVPAGAEPRPFDIAPVTDILAELRAGRMVILVDEEDRENEGDLVMAAEYITPDAINFMVTHGRGLVCLTLTEERCRQLDLPLMATRNGTRFGTNFTVSIEAAEGVETGISAADRARTIRVAVARDARPSDLVQPGHVFPVRAVPGGVLVRAGHTEAGCDLTAMAGLTPAAVICEILKPDGTMARLPDLVEFARAHGLKIGTIADLIQYRSEHESIVQRAGSRVMQTAWGEFQAVAYRDSVTDSIHLALTHGDIDPERETLVRVHEPASLLDVLDVGASAHSWGVSQALRAIAAAPAGVVVLMNCQPPGDALLRQVSEWNDAAAASAGGAPRQDGSPPRDRDRLGLRTYGIGAQILRDLNVGRMRLLARPRRMPSMTGFSLSVTGYDCDPPQSAQPHAQPSAQSEGNHS
jgi:3,4-dihydroxy 2-butanone 4-phosphate synthase/GTP cyclohydrolase II